MNMLWFILSAWVLGFLGSAHCIGMCGPLAMSLPMANSSNTEKIFKALIYNLGRICTYAMYGSLIGITQSLVKPFLFQNQLSILIGVLLIGVSMYFIFFKNKSIIFSKTNKFQQIIINALGKLYQSNSSKNIFLIGMLNGLLPCGLVYVALASAFASGTIFKSIVFMSFFGLGTLPAMWGMVIFAQYFSPLLRSYLRKVYPFVFAISGCLLIIRGLADTNSLHEMIHAACKK